jgi:hypothetical protein
VGLITLYSLEEDRTGGLNNPRFGGLGAGPAGGRPVNEKNANTDVCAFFLPSGPRPRGGGCSSPVEPLKEWVCDRRLTAWNFLKWFVWEITFCFAVYVLKPGNASGQAQGANLSYFLGRGGSPAARGRDYDCRPQTALSTLRW